jgi:hypothetical protein
MSCIKWELSVPTIFKYTVIPDFTLLPLSLTVLHVKINDWKKDVSSIKTSRSLSTRHHKTVKYINTFKCYDWE